jgi:hypothetical protein
MPEIIPNKNIRMLKYLQMGGFHGLEVVLNRYGMGRETIRDIIIELGFANCWPSPTARSRVVDQVLKRLAMVKRLSGEAPKSPPYEWQRSRTKRK